MRCFAPTVLTPRARRGALCSEKEVHFPPCSPPPSDSAVGAEEMGLADADRAMRVAWRWHNGLATFNSTFAAIRDTYGVEFA